jgi:hypothetical protein
MEERKTQNWNDFGNIVGNGAFAHHELAIIL